MRSGLIGLCAGQDLRRDRADLGFQLFEFLVDDGFVIREILLEPLESTLVIIGVDKFFESVELLIAHLVGQAHADIHLKFLVYLTQQ